MHGPAYDVIAKVSTGSISQISTIHGKSLEVSLEPDTRQGPNCNENRCDNHRQLHILGRFCTRASSECVRNHGKY